MGFQAKTVIPCLALVAATFSFAGCEDDAAEDHGYVKVEFKPSQNATMPYVGTATMSITMGYMTCLSRFYDTNTSFAQDGPDGAPVFDRWMDKLCDASESSVDCEVTEITQSLEDVKFLTVVYKINQADIEDRIALFGPLPTEELASCESSSPQVRLQPPQASGDDPGGNRLWFGQSVNPDLAETGQGLPMTLRATNDN